MTDEAGAIWLPNSNYWPGRAGNTPKYVILHGTAGGSSARNTAAFFQSTEGTDNPVSSHYIIDQSAVLVQTVAELNAAWSNGFLSPGHAPFWSESINPNLLTISIEHCKLHDDNSDPLTDVQQLASFRLVADICRRWRIPMHEADASGGITGHFSIDPVERSKCPGVYPWLALWDFLQGSGEHAPLGWRDDGVYLTAPNGKRVRQGFRHYVLTSAWDRDNWPLEEEEARDPLEVSNPALGKGTQQIFRWTTLEWTPDRGVFPMWTGQELLALRAQLQKTAAS